MSASFRAVYLSATGGDNMMAETSPAATLSRAATTWLYFVKSATIGGCRVANCASTWANHTSGLDSQKVGSLTATAWIAGAGSSLGTALRACAIARTSSAFRVIASSTSGSPLWRSQTLL